MCSVKVGNYRPLFLRSTNSILVLTWCSTISIDFVHVTEINHLVATGPGSKECTVKSQLQYKLKVFNECTSAGFSVVAKVP